jgi:predicted O-methyltransferase YrrM
MFKDNYFDFVFIDASHDYANVKSDIETWMPKVKPGGILGGDDYHDSWKGVFKAVDEKIKNQERNFLPAWYTKIPEIV